jgi:arylsulfatase A-like enzyme
VVLEALDTNGLAENTLLLVLTDHGIDYPAAKGCCNAAGLGTFLFARWPGGGWRQGAVCADLVSHVDLLPTLVGPCGLNPPEALSGFDLGPALRDGQTVGRTEVFAGKTYHDCYDPTRSIRTERWSYVRYFDEVQLQDLRLGSLECSTFRKAGFLRENREELFDFAADPDETRNLAADPAHEDTRRRMLRKLRDWMEATGDPLLRGPVPSRVYAADMKVFRET